MTQSSMPLITLAAAKFTELIPPPQKRSSVVPLALVSKPADSAAMRPRSPPCLPFCDEVDHMLSSTVAVSRLLRLRLAAMQLGKRAVMGVLGRDGVKLVVRVAIKKK